MSSINPMGNQGDNKTRMKIREKNKHQSAAKEKASRYTSGKTKKKLKKSRGERCKVTRSCVRRS